MGIEPSVALVQDGARVALPMSAAIGAAVAAALVVVLARRRLRAGLGAGVFVATVSGSALAMLAVDSDGRLAWPALGHVLTGLAVLWYALSRVAARAGLRPEGRDDAVAGDESARQWSGMLSYAGLACGLAALAAAVSRPAGVGVGDAWAADLAVLAVLAVLVWWYRTGRWGVYPAVAVLGGALVLVVPGEVLTPYAGGGGIRMIAAGILALAGVLGMIVAQWARRRRLWLEEPLRGVELAAWNDAMLVSLVGVSLLIGVAGVLLRDSALTPIASALAGLTCLIVGHLRVWLVAGEIGLVLVGESIVTAVTAWLWPGWSGALFGLGLAGIYLLWLARFWNQQLNEGVAWTTAGRLIPAARRLALVAAAGLIVPAVGAASGGGVGTPSTWSAAITTVLLLGFMSLLVRDAGEYGHPGAPFAACVAAAAAAWPGGHLLGELLGSSVCAPVAVAAGAALLALRVGLARGASVSAGVYIGYVGGIVTVALWFALSRSVDAQIAAGIIVTVGALVVLAARARATGHSEVAEREPRAG